MKIINWIFMAVFFLTAFAILIIAFKSRKPIKVLFSNAFFGILALGIIDLTAKFTGAYIPLNNYTVFGSMTYGIPAVSLFLILKLIFI